MRSRPCSTSGNDVVVPSRTALSVPIDAFTLTAANVASPASDTENTPSETCSPLRTNGTNTPTKSTSGSTTRARDHSTRGPTRPTTATATSASAQATNAGQA
jgi:hypothetical protein